MRRLRRFLSPNQEEDDDADDHHQDGANHDESRWHAAHYLAMMLHQEALVGATKARTALVGAEDEVGARPS